MEIKRAYSYCIAILLAVFLLLSASSCAKSAHPDAKKKPITYKQSQSKQAKWNTTRPNKTTYVIKDKQRKKKNPNF